MIKSRDLENRGDSANHPATPPDLLLELAELKRRIKAARIITPQGRDLHCRDCFERGRNAALRVIDGQE